MKDNLVDMKKKKEREEKPVKETKEGKIRNAKSTQFRNLIDDYAKMRESAIKMKDIVDSSIDSISENIKVLDINDKNASAKINAMSNLIFASLKLDENILNLHDVYSDLVEKVVPDDRIVVSVESNDEEAINHTASDALTRIAINHKRASNG